MAIDPSKPSVAVWDGTQFQVLDADGHYDAAATAAAQDFYLAAHPLPSVAPPPQPPVMAISPLAFMQRLSSAHRIAVRALAKTDPIAEDFLDLLSKATEVRLDNPDTIAGVGYLMSRNIGLTQADADALLAPVTA